MKPLSRETTGLLLGVVGVTIFGGTLPATRLAVQGLDPWFISAGRAAVSGLLSVAVLALLRRPWPGPAQLRMMLLTGCFIVIGFPVLMAMALQSVPAAHGGVVLGIMPLATAAAASVILGERPSLRFWACAVLGSVVVVGFALRDGGGRLESGDLYLFLAGILSSIGYVYSGQLSQRMPGWEVICWVLVTTLPLTLPAAIWLWPARIEAVPNVAWAGFAYVSLFSMFLGFFAWNAGMAMGGVARVSQVQLLQTFVTLGLSALVNGEKLDPETLLAAVAVVGVVAIGRKARVAPG